jgi:magnesium-transporting ATPase (P-type)
MRQSNLAAWAAPPIAPTLSAALSKLIALMFFLWLAGIVALSQVEPLIPNKVQQGVAYLSILAVLLLLSLIIFISVWRSHKKLKRSFAQRFSEWQNTWACLKCGATWQYE